MSTMNIESPFRHVSYNLCRGKASFSGGREEFPSGTSNGRASTGLIGKSLPIRGLAYKIENNLIVSLRIHGFENARTLGRDLSLLSEALNANTSLEEVAVCWTVQEKSVTSFLKSIAKLQNLRRLCLKSYTWVAEEVMSFILGNKALVELECQGVWIRSALSEQQTVVESLAADKNAECSIERLRLIRCSLRDDDCCMLNDLSRRSGSNIKELCLKGNRMISSNGLYSLAMSRVSRLDLTDCNLTCNHLPCFIRAKAEGNLFLDELVLAQNDKISLGGDDGATFLEFAHFCIAHLKELNLSDCRIEDREMQSFLGLLRTDGCILESFTCHGSFSIPIEDIATTLVKNRSLTSLVLDTCRDEYHSNLKERSQFVQSLKLNHNLKVLEIRCCGNDLVYLEDDYWEEQIDAVRAEVDFLLRLNRAGRKVLLEDGCAGNPAVLRQLVGKMSSYGDDVLFWFLKNGLSSLIRQNKFL